MAEGSDDIPAGYVLPQGATLVERREPTWSYAVARKPEVVAAELVAALEAAGWKTVTRHIGAMVPTVTAAAPDGRVVVAIADFDRDDRTHLIVVANPIHKLLTTPPPGYPAGFPFVRFGAVQDEARTDRTVLVYSATGLDIFKELGDELVAGAWDCSGDLDTLLVCRKGTIEVTVSLHELSTDRVVLFVSNAEPRLAGGPAADSPEIV